MNIDSVLRALTALMRTKSVEFLKIFVLVSTIKCVIVRTVYNLPEDGIVSLRTVHRPSPNGATSF